MIQADITPKMIEQADKDISCIFNPKVIKYRYKPYLNGLIGSGIAISRVVDTLDDSYLVETPFGIKEVKFKDVLK